MDEIKDMERKDLRAWLDTQISRKAQDNYVFDFLREMAEDSKGCQSGLDLAKQVGAVNFLSARIADDSEFYFVLNDILKFEEDCNMDYCKFYINRGGKKYIVLKTRYCTMYALSTPRGLEMYDEDMNDCGLCTSATADTNIAVLKVYALSRYYFTHTDRFIK